MDSKLADALNRIADLEMQLVDAESKNQHFRETVHNLEKERSHLNARLRTASSIMEDAGLVLSDDNSLVTDSDKVARIKACLKKGLHMEMFETLNRDNPMLQSAWAKYMVAIRLAGFDGENQLEQAS